MSTLLDKTIGVGLMVVVIFTALAHGAVEVWSVAIFKLMVAVLLLLWAVKIGIDKRLTLTVPSTVFPLLALVMLGLAQSIVLTHGSGNRRSLSMDVEATRVAVTTLSCLLIALIVAANFITGRERLRALGKFLTTYGLLVAVFALVQHFAWNGRFYWLRPMAVVLPSPFGPFFNHNHFAGYLELIFPAPVALLVMRGAGREERLFYGFAAAMMGVAIIVSLSRGGMISLFAEMMLLGVVSLRVARRRQRENKGTLIWRAEGTAIEFYSPPPRPHLSSRRRSKSARLSLLLSQAGAVAAIIVAIAASLFWLGADPVIERVTRGQTWIAGGQPETFFTSRGWIWKDTLAMFRANLIAGVGLGAFQTAYPIYSQHDQLIVRQAHNDYLQMLADGGVIGGTIAVWFLIVVGRAVVRGCRASDPLLASLALGGGVGIFGMLVHSLFDFNLQLPSNALLFLILSAVVSHIGAVATKPEVEATTGSTRPREVRESVESFIREVPS